MRQVRKAELQTLIRELSTGFSGQDAGKILGISANHAYRVAKQIGVTFHPISRVQLLAKLDPSLAERCADFVVHRSDGVVMV